MMNEELKTLTEEALSRILSSEKLDELNDIRTEYVGKKGRLTGMLKDMKNLSDEDKPKLGQMVNDSRARIERAVEETKTRIRDKALKERLDAEAIDITLPGKKPPYGHTHPNQLVLDQIIDIFVGMGYEVIDGPEIEWEYNNFTKLNIPEFHPARDEQDTFYITDKILLRSQTSTTQVTTMEEGRLPIRMISPGRVYRSDNIDATHSPMFHQVEGLVIDKHITMTDLKGTLTVFAKQMFGKDTRTRFRPHHFPFTEPSAEVDVSCFKCGGVGCGFCQGSGWIEILGCGMVHPNVLRMCGIDDNEYMGFAFGVGLERVAVLKYEIDDMRLLYEGDLRFLRQF